jgi:serine/threonine-protein kinase
VVDGFQIWAGRAEGPLGDLLVMTDRAARDLSAAIAGAQVAPARRHADPAELVEAHVRARTFLSAILDDEKLVERLAVLRATAPDEPKVLSYLAITTARVAGFSGDPKVLAQARGAAERAIELAPSLGEPWVAMAHARFNGADTPGAMRALRLALRHGPSVADAHDLAGRLLHEADRHDEAIRFLDRAVWLDPALSFARGDRARIHAYRGDWDQVERELEVLAELSPVHFATAISRFWMWRGRPFGPPARGAVSLRVRDVMALSRKAITGGLLDDDDLAMITRWLESVPPGTRGTRLFNQIGAELYLKAGARDLAVGALARAVEGGLEDLGWVRRCPVLDPLRGSPELDEAERVVAARADATLRAWAEG